MKWGVTLLKNTVYKLNREKSLRIAFFGGSITQGAGASDPEKFSYRAKTVQWFKEKYPSADITEIYAAIGGTGTAYGTFRCETDVLQYNPDLVFVEFAANDNGDDYDKVLLQTKTIFKKILAKNPLTDIVILFSSTKEIMEYVERGVEFTARSAQTAAAHIYNIPTIDHGAAFHAHIRKSGRDICDFIPDELHPNDEGYSVIANCIISRLEEMLSCDVPASLVDKEIPSEAYPYEGAYIADPSALANFKADGFELKDSPSGERFGQYLSTKAPGASFSFDFEGTCFGFIWAAGFFSHDVSVRIDEGEAIRALTWDYAVRSFHRFDNALFVKNLPEGKHHVKVSAEYSSADDSSSELVGISGILLCR